MTIFYCAMCEEFEDSDKRTILHCPVCKIPMQAINENFKGETPMAHKPFTHCYCQGCKWQQPIANMPHNKRCPACQRPLIKLRHLYPSLVDERKGKAKVSEPQQLPKKLVGRIDPPDIFLGIKGEKV